MADLDALANELKDFTSKAQTTLETQNARLQSIEQKLTAPGLGGGGDYGSDNDIGRKLIESEGYKNLASNNGRTTGRISVGSFYQRKATIVSGSGTGQPLVAPEFRPGVVGPGQQKITVRDLMPNIPTQSNLIEFTRESSNSDATAIQVNEGDTKGESALGFELAYTPVRTIASWIPCSTQILNDAPALQAYVGTRLTYFNALKVEKEILLGSGTGTEISGLSTNASVFDTTRVNPATDSFIDVLGIALTQASESLFDPDAVILNPKDWSRIQRIKTATTNEYIFADPHSGGGKVLWGCTVVPSWSMPESQFLVGSFAMGAAVWDRNQATVEISREHSDYFVRNLAAILCESRLAMTVFRPTAFVWGGFPFGS
jgi:HK97 family phage major capsid protein